ncbi:hypothetical protein SeLEV6574_g04267 [Synchytrium endobioticum]|uniref:GTP-binding protein n=1 Tax=Synchytrium endobioticum TaxID=286115 RepID=A0A507D066_9FUNG|nr:hypothetical protein SeLEV6574_g04267 [Synchytrium endobioticum]
MEALGRNFADYTTLPEKPRLLLVGLRRSGKSSIRRVVFYKMAANDTLYLEPTVHVNDPSFRSDAIFATCKVLVFVIDSQDDSLDAVQRLHGIVAEAYKVNPSIHFEVFIHKADQIGPSDERGGLTLRTGTRSWPLGPQFLWFLVGMIIKMGRGCVSWSSKKQSTIALSSSEAEYYALGDAIKEIFWLQNLLEGIQYHYK